MLLARRDGDEAGEQPLPIELKNPTFAVFSAVGDPDVFVIVDIATGEDDALVKQRVVV